MKIAIIGNGKMGKSISEIAEKRGHEIVCRFDEYNTPQMAMETLKLADVAFEFTEPKSVFNNIMTCFDADLPVVCGTTGWLDKLDLVKQRCNAENKTLFYAPNFSVGMYIFSLVNKHLTSLINKVGNYDFSIKEIHHTQKKDAPSGTAIKLAEDIINISDKYNSWMLNPENQTNKLPVYAERIGNETGTHEIKLESDLDIIEIKHKIKTRNSLALGAVMAGEFCYNKTGFLSMEDMLN